MENSWKTPVTKNENGDIEALSIPNKNQHKWLFKKSKSESPLINPKEDKKPPKSKTFKRLFSRKKHLKDAAQSDENEQEKSYNQSLSKQNEKEICSFQLEALKPKKQGKYAVIQNSKLKDEIRQLEAHYRNKQQEIEALTRHIESLDKTVEICHQKAESKNKILKERDALRTHLKSSQTDVENMELEIAFLQEEKEELEEEMRKLSDDYQGLQQKQLGLERDRDHYKTQYVATQARADATIRDVCDTMCDVVEQNRFLIKHGLKGKPADFQSILKSTDDYLALQSEKNCLMRQIEKKTTRIVAQEVYISDLKVELASAVNQIMKAGLDYTSRVIGESPDYLQVLRDDYVLPLNGGEDICKCLDDTDPKPRDHDQPSHPDGASSTDANRGGSKDKFDPTKMSGKQLFSHMKHQMNDKVIAPAAKMVNENITEPAAKKAGDLKPNVTQAALGTMPLEAAIKMCCKTCCSCMQNCCGAAT